MKSRLKRLFIMSVSICVVLAVILSGCGQAPSEPASVPVPEPVPTPAPPTTPAPTPTPQLAPSVSTGSIAKLDISKAPRLGETANLAFTLDVTGPLKPVTKVWLEFERYDPALYYPLGRGLLKERIQEILSKINPTHGDYYYLTQAAKEQPESLVTPDAVVVSGDVSWQGERLKVGDQVRFDATVRFPEEGEWLINARWQVEGERAYVRSDLYLTVTEDSGMIGWPKDYSSGAGQGTHKPTMPERPVGIFINLSRAPLLGEPMPLTVVVESIRDLDQSEVSLEFRRMEGYWPVDIPLPDVVVEGDFTWQGSLKKGVPVEFSGVLRFPEEGDWQISGWSRPSPGSLKVYMNSIFIHVGKQKSLFGWTENHDRPTYDPLRPYGQPPPVGAMKPGDSSAGERSTRT